MTPEQIEVAARKLCELRGWKWSPFWDVHLSEVVVARIEQRKRNDVDEAIKYALEQK
jgi:hypothetical protein